MDYRTLHRGASGVMPKVTSIRLPDELVDGLDRVARSLDRPRSWVILQALMGYVREQEDYVRDLQQALAEVDAGTAVLTAHEDVMAELEHMLEDAVGPDPRRSSGDAPNRVA
jgi:predicted transcriptional regulator